MPEQENAKTAPDTDASTSTTPGPPVPMAKTYRAVLNLDYTGTSNEYQYLVSALIQAGWTYVETSALILETDDRADIWRGMSLVMKQDSSIPDLSALTLHIQASEDFSGIPYPFADAHPNALDNVEIKTHPTAGGAG